MLLKKCFGSGGFAARMISSGRLLHEPLLAIQGEALRYALAQPLVRYGPTLSYTITEDRITVDISGPMSGRVSITVIDIPMATPACGSSARPKLFCNALGAPNFLADRYEPKAFPSGRAKRYANPRKPRLGSVSR